MGSPGNIRKPCGFPMFPGLHILKFREAVLGEKCFVNWSVKAEPNAILLQDTFVDYSLWYWKVHYKELWNSLWVYRNSQECCPENPQMHNFKELCHITPKKASRNTFLGSSIQYYANFLIPFPKSWSACIFRVIAW